MVIISFIAAPPGMANESPGMPNELPADPCTPLSLACNVAELLLYLCYCCCGVGPTWPRGTYCPYFFSFLRKERLREKAPSMGSPASMAALQQKSERTLMAF